VSYSLADHNPIDPYRFAYQSKSIVQHSNIGIYVPSASADVILKAKTSLLLLRCQVLNYGRGRRHCCLLFIFSCHEYFGVSIIFLFYFLEGGLKKKKKDVSETHMKLLY
jgi:hypothetical protein